MFRFLAAHLPDFSLERCDHLAEELSALTIEEHGAARIYQPTTAARRQGVAAGMPAAAARALAPNLRLQLVDLEGQKGDLEDLARSFSWLSPRVAALPPRAIVAELTGSPGGASRPVERACIARAQRRFAELGHRATTVIADSPLVALTCAIWGDGCRVVPPGGDRRALAPLPLIALSLPEPEAALLFSLGLDTVADFAELPAAALSGRLGPGSLVAHSLACGRSPPAMLRCPETDGSLRLSQPLPEPVSCREALLFVLEALLVELCTRLLTGGQAISRLTIHLELDALPGDAREERHPVRLGAPTRSPSRILEVLRQRLENHTVSAPIQQVSLEIPAPDRWRGQQPGLFSRRQTGESAADLTARLQNTLGSDAVFVPELCNRHRPEAAWRRAPLAPHILQDEGCGRQSPPAPIPLPASLRRAWQDDPERIWRGAGPPMPPPRPPIVLRRPRPIEVAGEGTPEAMTYDGRWREVVAARGPEVLDTEWWQRSPLRREYWWVLLQGGVWAWVFREVEGWALHGWGDL